MVGAFGDGSGTRVLFTHRLGNLRHGRGPFALPPAPSRSHVGSVDQASSRGRGSQRAAGLPTRHRSASPTDARSVGSDWIGNEFFESGTARRCSFLRPRRAWVGRDDQRAGFFRSLGRKTPMQSSCCGTYRPGGVRYGTDGSTVVDGSKTARTSKPKLGVRRRPPSSQGVGGRVAW
jgi:hypothetical protein